MDTKKLLMTLSEAIGVSGKENEAHYVIEDILKKYKPTRTNLGSLICNIKPVIEDKPHVIVVAHIDEIGLIVTDISDNGFVKVAPVGGIDRHTLLSAPVIIHGKEKVNGVICSTPPHLQVEEAKKLPKADEVYIDTGYNKEALKELVKSGDRVTVNIKAKEMLNDIVTGKALDNRSGCAVLIKLCEYLENENINCGVTLVFSGMEEVGAQGAKTSAALLNPTHAIVVDVSFAHTPDAKPENCGKLFGGPMVGFAPILCHDSSELLCDLATKNNIPYQREIMSKGTGTDADVVAVNNLGVKTMLVSVPLRYMHTATELVSAIDVENSAMLICKYLGGVS